MIFGYSTNAFVRYTLEESIEKIARLGFKGVEIMGDRPHLYPPDYNEEKLIHLKSCLEKNRLRVNNINSFTLFAVGDTYLPSWIEPEAERREMRILHTLQSLQVAKVLGCSNISVPPGGPLEKNMTRKQAFSLFYEGLEKVIPAAENLNITILVEPEPGLLIENTSEFTQFIKNIQSSFVGLNFDIGHFYCAGENPAESFETLFEYAGHVHLEDIADTRLHNHLIPGLGAVDLKEVLSVMVRLGYRGDISLELYPYTDMPEEAGRKTLEYIRPIFKEVGYDL
ncbi:MAG: sugar phosphate isomerase/epimerase family protein [Desulfobacterales bacterium]